MAGFIRMLAAPLGAAKGALGGSLGDQWLEAIKPLYTDDQTVMTKGVFVREDDKRNRNNRGTRDIVSNGSIVHVPMGHAAILVDGGEIVDYTEEAGYAKVDTSASPSFLSGDFKGFLKDALMRFQFAGTSPLEQKVFYINLQELKGIKFGTRNPVIYYDQVYDMDLYIRAHGSYSIRIVNPVLFYREALSKSAEHVTVADVNSQYLDEFLGAFQATLNQLSTDGIRASQIPSQTMRLNSVMEEILDEDWRTKRGIEIESVGIASINLDQDSQDLLKRRSKGVALSDPLIREGYVQGSVADGLEAAGSNTGGAMQGFMGVGVGMGASGMGGGMMQNSSQNNMEQYKMQQEERRVQENQASAANKWACPKCSADNNGGNFCRVCGEGRDNAEWKCSDCGKVNEGGGFCTQCGTAKPVPKEAVVCKKCGFTPPADSEPKFCPECGNNLVTQNNADKEQADDTPEKKE